LQGLGLWSFSKGGLVKMALYSHADNSSQDLTCSTKGRPHLLLTSTSQIKPMDVGRVELSVRDPVRIEADQEYWIVALYDQHTAFHGKVNQMEKSETESIPEYASYAHVCEFRHDFRTPFPTQFPSTARKREDTHNYWMCIVPRSSREVLAGMDRNAALIDEREKEAYSTFVHHQRPYPAIGNREDEENMVGEQEFEFAAVCKCYKPFQKEKEAWEAVKEVRSRREVAAQVFCAYCHALFSDRYRLNAHQCPLTRCSPDELRLPVCQRRDHVGDGEKEKLLVV
jgi:hypothetical protein